MYGDVAILWKYVKKIFYISWFIGLCLIIVQAIISKSWQHIQPIINTWILISIIDFILIKIFDIEPKYKNGSFDE